MKLKTLVGNFLLSGLILSACQPNQTQIATVENDPIISITATKEPSISAQASPTIPTSIPLVTQVLQSDFYVRTDFALQIPRSQHTATLLSNGKILLVGGSLELDDFVADEELFDPITGSSTWIAPLHTPRHGHTATLLLDGRVLVIGGYGLPQQWLSDAEVYDPVSDTWSIVPPQYSHGTAHTATLMQDGRVLVVGGCIGGGVCTNRVEIFDPKSDSWSEAASLLSSRFGHTAQLLANGHVLVAGGTAEITGIPTDGTASIYEPETNTWAATGVMNTPRQQGESVRLNNGSVLVAGGISLSDPSGQTITDSTEIYDPATNTWKSAANLSQARYAFALAFLPNGKVLAIGGTRHSNCCWSEDSFIKEIEIYNPAKDSWSIIGEMPQPRVYATGLTLPNGWVWIAGGRSNQTGLTYSPDTWLIVPSSP